MTRIKQAGMPVLMVILVAGIVGYVLGSSGSGEEGQSLVSAVHGESPGAAASVRESATGKQIGTWSPTKPYPTHEVYYPGTEELKPDEMRVIACGTGMPMPRLKQAAACFVIELGNGD